MKYHAGIQNELEIDALMPFMPGELSDYLTITEIKTNIQDRSTAKKQLYIRAAFFDFIMKPKEEVQEKVESLP